MGGMGDVSRLNRDAHYWGLKPLARDNLLGGRTQASGSGTKHEGHRAFYGTNGQFGQDGDWIAGKPRHTLERGWE